MSAREDAARDFGKALEAYDLAVAAQIRAAIRTPEHLERFRERTRQVRRELVERAKELIVKAYPESPDDPLGAAFDAAFAVADRILGKSKP